MTSTYRFLLLLKKGLLWKEQHKNDGLKKQKKVGRALAIKKESNNFFKITLLLRHDTLSVTNNKCCEV